MDEKALISTLGKWHPEQRQSFRKGSRDFFREDERKFERWDDRHILQLRHEFLRLKVCRYMDMDELICDSAVLMLDLD